MRIRGPIWLTAPAERRIDPATGRAIAVARGLVVSAAAGTASFPVDVLAVTPAAIEWLVAHAPRSFVGVRGALAAVPATDRDGTGRFRFQVVLDPDPPGPVARPRGRPRAEKPAR